MLCILHGNNLITVRMHYVLLWYSKYGLNYGYTSMMFILFALWLLPSTVLKLNGVYESKQELTDEKTEDQKLLM